MFAIIFLRIRHIFNNGLNLSQTAHLVNKYLLRPARGSISCNNIRTSYTMIIPNNRYLNLLYLNKQDFFFLPFYFSALSIQSLSFPFLYYLYYYFPTIALFLVILSIFFA